MGCKQAQIKTSHEAIYAKLNSIFEQDIFLQNVFILLPVHAFPIMIGALTAESIPAYNLM